MTRETNVETLLLVAAVDAAPACTTARWLVERRPEAVVAAVLGAAPDASVFLAVGADTDTEAVEAAWAQAGAASPLRIARLQRDLMLTQPTSLANLLAGRPPIARAERPARLVAGLGAVPVVLDLVAAVEQAEPDVLAVTVAGAVVAPGVVTVPRGASLTEVIEAAGGLVEGATLQFAVVGGVGGCYLTPSASDAPLTWPDAAARVVEVVDATACPVDDARVRFGVLLAENCGFCVSCSEGSYQATAMITDATNGRAQATDTARLRELARTLESGSLCAVGRGAAGVLDSLLEGFGPVLDAHRRKRCPSGACAAFRTYHVLPDLCTGCTDCLDACLDDAINGKKGFVHVINADDCTRCGECVPACPEDAIVTAGAVKPKTPSRPVRIAR